MPHDFVLILAITLTMVFSILHFMSMYKGVFHLPSMSGQISCSAWTNLSLKNTKTQRCTINQHNSHCKNQHTENPLKILPSYINNLTRHNFETNINSQQISPATLRRYFLKIVPLPHSLKTKSKVWAVSSQQRPSQNLPNSNKAQVPPPPTKETITYSLFNVKTSSSLSLHISKFSENEVDS